MPWKRLWITALAVVALVSSLASAQEEKNQLTGIVGRTFISNEGIKGATFSNPFVGFGNGFSFEVNYSRYVITTPLFALSGEVPVVVNFDEDINSGADVVPSDYRSYFITPAARVNLLPAMAVSPWVSFGAGFGHFSENSSLISGGTNPGKSNTTGVLQAGFGLDVRIWRRISIRGEVRDFWSGGPDFPLAPTGKTRQHNFFVGAGATWHF
jgi:PII-like signaling protein